MSFFERSGASRTVRGCEARAHRRPPAGSRPSERRAGARRYAPRTRRPTCTRRAPGGRRGSVPGAFSLPPPCLRRGSGRDPRTGGASSAAPAWRRPPDTPRRAPRPSSGGAPFFRFGFRDLGLAPRHRLPELCRRLGAGLAVDGVALGAAVGHLYRVLPDPPPIGAPVDAPLAVAPPAALLRHADPFPSGAD